MRCFVFWAFTPRPRPLPKIQNGKILFTIINNETATRENIKNDKKFTSYNSRHAVTLLVPRRSTHNGVFSAPLRKRFIYNLTL